MKSDIPTYEQMIEHSKQSKRVGNGGGDNDDDNDIVRSFQKFSIIFKNCLKLSKITRMVRFLASEAQLCTMKSDNLTSEGSKQSAQVEQVE